MKQNRLRSWPLWTALAALIVFCLKEFCDMDLTDPVSRLMDVLLPVLVGFGIVNDPTSKDSF